MSLQVVLGNHCQSLRPHYQCSTRKVIGTGTTNTCICIHACRVRNWQVQRRCHLEATTAHLWTAAEQSLDSQAPCAQGAAAVQCCQMLSVRGPQPLYAPGYPGLPKSKRKELLRSLLSGLLRNQNATARAPLLKEPGLQGRPAPRPAPRQPAAPRRTRMPGGARRW